MRRSTTAIPIVSLIVIGLPAAASAATYSMGPGGDYAQFADLPPLMPGDIVEVAGGATYDAYWFQDPGAPGNPIVIRGIRSADGRRPVISGGRNTVELSGNHYVLEGFEITGGSARCVYHHAHDITVRDCVIHDCPSQGLLGADTDSGSLLLEYTEIYACGGGDRDHQVYMSTDQETYPGSVFRMQFCWVHDGNGGNGIKSRAERNEIYYNWIESSFYHELELIGPDPGGTSIPEDAYREDSDVVGNVFVKGGLNPDHWVVRFGGDGTGQSNGRYRFVHNTVVLAAGTAGVFRLFDGIESLEAHNNVIFHVGSGDPQIVRDSEAAWVGGTRRVAGRNNWLIEGTGARDVPAEWTGTLRGADPGFESLGGDDLRPAMGSPLADAADPAPAGIAGFDFPRPEALPRFHPPARVLLAVGTAAARPMVGDRLDIGAYELGSGPPVMPPDAGPPPPDAGPPPPVDAGPPCMPDCTGRMCGDDGCGGSCGGCAAPLECDATGNCACVAPRLDCGGECVDTGSDPGHCGACGTLCGDEEVCSLGECSAGCASGLDAC
ncbi:MAG: hypothetical protein IT379_04505, partial [Deltaproteobacteria bacterium]|nr:hypothetical protein [Deltaproteobacteria bacterium]